MVWVCCSLRPVMRRPGAAKPVEDDGGASGSAGVVEGTSKAAGGVVEGTSKAAARQRHIRRARHCDESTEEQELERLRQ